MHDHRNDMHSAGTTEDAQSLIAANALLRGQVEELQRRAAFLADASEQLAASHDYQNTLERVTRLIVPEMADWCVADAFDDDGGPQLVAVTHADPAKVALVHELRRRYPLDPHAPHGLAKVLRTGQAEWYPEIQEAWRVAAARDERHLGLMRALAARSSMCVPLRTRGRTIGALTFVQAESGRGYGPTDLALAEELASRCALALDNARLHDQLRETLRQREDFLASVAHDLKNPLTAIQGFAQLLTRRVVRAGGDDATDLLEHLGHIRTNAVTMTALLEELLDAARLEAGQQLPLKRGSTDLVALAREATERQPKEDQSVRLETEVAELRGNWDAMRLRRVLANLIGNSLKYNRAGGEVMVSVGREDGWALLRVRDRGVGIPVQDLPHIFERFRRGKNVQGRVAGTGLGLWGVRRIVQQHGGSVDVASQEGQGTTVTVRLPLSGATG